MTILSAAQCKTIIFFIFVTLEAMDADFGALPQDFEDIYGAQSKTRRSHFNLLDLPIELVLRILELSVVVPRPIKPTFARQCEKQAKLVEQPAITRTCRLLRKEGLPLFYRLNVFEAYQRHGTACVRKWLVAIGHANRCFMKIFIFHAQADVEFWKHKFAACGIEVEIDIMDESSDHDQTHGFGELVVTFR